MAYLLLTREKHRELKKMFMLLDMNRDKIYKAQAEHIMARCMSRGFASAFSLLKYYIHLNCINENP